MGLIHQAHHISLGFSKCGFDESSPYDIKLFKMKISWRQINE